MTKYLKLANQLKKKHIIGAPSLTPLPSISKLMREYKLSQATVDKALNLLVAEALIKKIDRKGTFTTGRSIKTESEDQLYEDGEFSNIYLTESRTIKLAVIGRPGVDNPLWHKIKEGFEHRFSDIRVDLIYSHLMINDIMTLLNTQTPPDLIHLTMGGNCSFYHTVRKGLLAKLDDFILKSSIPFESIFPNVRQEAYYKGNIYGVPNSITLKMLFYDRDIFKKIGIAPANNWSWDEFLRICQMIDTQRDKHNLDCLFLMYNYLAYFLHWGIVPYDSHRKKLSFEGKKVEEGLAFLKHLYQRLRAFPLCSSLTEDRFFDIIKNKRCPMFFARTPSFWRMQKEGVNNLGVLKVPIAPGGYQHLGINLLGIYRYSRFPDLAGKFIEYVCSAEGQKIIAKTQQELPTCLSNENDFRGMSLYFKTSQEFGETVKNAKLIYQDVACFAEFKSSIFNFEIESFLKGDTTIEKCIANINRLGRNFLRNAAMHHKRIGTKF